MADLKQLQEKWAPVLEHDSLPKIEDSHKRGVVAQLLENQEFAAREESQMLTEAPTNSAGTGGLVLVLLQQVLLLVLTLYSLV